MSLRFATLHRALATTITAALLAALLATAAVAAGPAGQAGASPLDGPFTPHPSLVPEIPETGYPIILNTPTYPFNGFTGFRQTRAVDLIDGYIVSGGDFFNIELQNGQVISQPYLTIFNGFTKEIVCTNLDVNNEVLAIVRGPEPGTAIIGGKFSTVTGADGVTRFKSRIAKINMGTCEVDNAWSAGSTNSKVTELAVNGDRLFVGGDFTSIGGQSIERLAELDFDTGALNPNFSFNFGGELSRAIVGLEANPAGTRLAIVHRTTSIDGNSMRGTAVFDISNPNSPSLTGHRMSTSANAYANYNKIQDGAVSPDFSRIGIAAGFNTAADYITLVPTGETSNQFSWQHFMRDSNTGIGISNNAVYVAGHFCKPDGGAGSALLAPNSGPSSCTGSNNFAGGVWRTQFAALRLADGAPLNWNPGNDAFRGGTAVTVVSRGLLIGNDGQRTNNRRVGGTAFFDFGGAEPPPPPPPPPEDQTCTATLNGDDTVTLEWTAIAGENNYIVRRNNSFLATVGNTLTYDDAPGTGTFTYVIRSNMGGVQTNTTCTPDITIDGPPPPGEQTCTATLNGDDTVTLDWTAIAGENSYIVRRNNGWIASPGNTLTYDDAPGTGTFTYVIRSNMGGVQTNTTCTPDITIGDPPPPGGQTCTATVNGNGSVTLDWTAIAGENNYIVRKNGSWLSTVGNVLTFTDTNGDAGDSYVIRSSMGGVQTNTTCD